MISCIIHPIFPHWLHLKIVQYQNQEIVKHFCTMKFVVVVPHLYTVILPFQKVLSVILFSLWFPTTNLLPAFYGGGSWDSEDAWSHTATVCAGLTLGLVLVPHSTVLAIPSAPKMPGPLLLGGRQGSTDVCASGLQDTFSGWRPRLALPPVHFT